MGEVPAVEPRLAQIEVSPAGEAEPTPRLGRRTIFLSSGELVLFMYLTLRRIVCSRL
jgi:hypothetical protein